MTRQAESSIKWRFSGNQKQYVADALRRECGAKAQRFDQAMRQDQAKQRPLWDVLQRWKTLQAEREQKAHDDLVRESRQRLLRVGTRSIGKYLVDLQQEQAPQGGGEPLRHRDEDYSLKL